jgi:restriction system protein
MLRRRNENLLDQLAKSPWWVSMIFGGIVYVGLTQLLPALTANNAILNGLASNLRDSAGIFASIFLLMALLSLLGSFKRRKLLDGQSGLDSIRAMSWRQFELLCGEAFRRKGYLVEENGLGGADGGVDLILRAGGERVLVQCKRWRTFKVGVREIRELFGILAADHADRAVFVSSGAYTTEARTFAKGKPLQLIDGHALLELVREVQKNQPRQKHSVSSSFSEPLPIPDSLPPQCPRCGSAMVLRTAKRGSHAGAQFWGCSAYPKCRGVIDST